LNNKFNIYFLVCCDNNGVGQVKDSQTPFDSGSLSGGSEFIDIASVQSLSKISK
jgi:hypothetical protein